MYPKTCPEEHTNKAARKVPSRGQICCVAGRHRVKCPNRPNVRRKVIRNAESVLIMDMTAGPTGGFRGLDRSRRIFLRPMVSTFPQLIYIEMPRDLQGGGTAKPVNPSPRWNRFAGFGTPFDSKHPENVCPCRSGMKEFDQLRPRNSKVSGAGRRCIKAPEVETRQATSRRFGPEMLAVFFLDTGRDATDRNGRLLTGLNPRGRSSALRSGPALVSDVAREGAISG